jgi:DNA-binding NarL/FixJ family response regulator
MWVVASARFSGATTTRECNGKGFTLAAYVLTVEDHPLFRSALKLAIGRACPEAEIAEAGGIGEALRVIAERGAPLLALLDLNLPDANGFGGLIELRAASPNIAVAIVSGEPPETIAAAAQRMGATGFIPKSASLDDMVDALHQLTAGLTCFPPEADAPVDREAEAIASLTLAQQRVLIGLQKGLLNKQIAYDSGITEATVKAHMTAIFRKLGVHSRTQAVLAARRWLNAGADERAL